MWYIFLNFQSLAKKIEYFINFQLQNNLYKKGMIPASSWQKNTPTLSLKVEYTGRRPVFVRRCASAI